MAQPTQEEVDRVIAAYENAKAAKEYADSLVLDTEKISGNDYRMVWSTQYPTN